MNDVLSHARYSIAHGRRHIAALEALFTEFWALPPFKQVVADDEAAGVSVHKWIQVRDLPMETAGVFFDAVGNLRAALDQASHSAAEAAGYTGQKATSFPFGTSEAEARKNAKKNSHKVPEHIREAMLGCRPWPGGNDPLWALHQVCIAAKHRRVLRPEIVFNGGGFAPVGKCRLSNFKWPPAWDPVLREAIIAAVPLGEPLPFAMMARTEVWITGTEGVKPLPCLQALQIMAQAAEMAVQAVGAAASASGGGQP